MTNNPSYMCLKDKDFLRNYLQMVGFGYKKFLR